MQNKYKFMQIDKNLYNEIDEYCKLNNLKTRDFIHKILKDSFLKEKYGESPFCFKQQEENKIKDDISFQIGNKSNVITADYIPITTETITNSDSKEFSETQNISFKTKIKKKRKLS